MEILEPSGERVVSLMAVMMWHASRKPYSAQEKMNVFRCFLMFRVLPPASPPPFVVSRIRWIGAFFLLKTLKVSYKHFH
jgi:hypothetical protein